MSGDIPLAGLGVEGSRRPIVEEARAISKQEAQRKTCWDIEMLFRELGDPRYDFHAIDVTCTAHKVRLVIKKGAEHVSALYFGDGTYFMW